MKRILYIESNTDGTIGGSYYSLLFLVQGLDKSKYEPHVVFLQDHTLVPLYRKVTPNIYIHNDRARKPLRNSSVLNYFNDVFMKYRLMQRLIATVKPDLVHLNNGYSNIEGWVLACYVHSVKIIAHDRGTTYPCSFRAGVFCGFLEAIISVSDSFKHNVVSQKLKVKHAFRVYNGMDLDRVASALDANSVLSVKREFGLEGKAPIVGIVANVDRWKGQIIVLQAIKLITRDYPDIKCLVVGAVCKGAEPYQKELELFVEQNRLVRNVIFTGFRPDVLVIMNALDVLIHASVEPEPFGRVILEGMALAKPIIGTNSGGTPEQIIDGETGFLVPMGDADAMAKALALYLSDMDRAREMGRKGQQRMLEHFSIARMVKETENIYAQVLDAG